VTRPINATLGLHIPSWLLDYAPVVLIALEGVAALRFHAHGSGPRSGLLWAALAVNCLALLLRHRAPLIVLGVVLACALVANWAGVVIFPAMLAVFTVAEYRERGTVAAATIVAIVALSCAHWVHGEQAGQGIIPQVAAIGFAVAAGLFLRARADYVGGLEERAERLEREHELLARQAVGDERVRIARELHDVVAHNVSLMVVQAQALAATTASADPEQQAALGQVAGLGREAMSEMHRMLGVLRPGDATGDTTGNAAEREPQPGVGDLPALLARTRATGLEATLAIEGDQRELPPGVELSAYRIVQEALTNVVRHAGADQVAVTLSYAPAELLVTVLDDGVGPAQEDGSARGHGLVGMAERVALFGGMLEIGAPGPRAGRRRPGYRVHASLPTG